MCDGETEHFVKIGDENAFNHCGTPITGFLTIGTAVKPSNLRLSMTEVLPKSMPELIALLIPYVLIAMSVATLIGFCNAGSAHITVQTRPLHTTRAAYAVRSRLRSFSF